MSSAPPNQSSGEHPVAPRCGRGRRLWRGGWMGRLYSGGISVEPQVSTPWPPTCGRGRRLWRGGTGSLCSGGISLECAWEHEDRDQFGGLAGSGMEGQGLCVWRVLRGLPEVPAGLRRPSQERPFCAMGRRAAGTAGLSCAQGRGVGMSPRSRASAWLGQGRAGVHVARLGGITVGSGQAAKRGPRGSPEPPWPPGFLFFTWWWKSVGGRRAHGGRVGFLCSC